MKEADKQLDIFCQIIAGQKSCYRIIETKYLLGILDIDPFSPGHTLLLPKQHVTTLEELTPAIRADLIETASFISQKLKDTFGYVATTVLCNSGSLIQDIPHLHCQIYGSPKGYLKKSIALDSVYLAIKEPVE